MESRVFLLFVGLLIIGVAGYLAFLGLWVRYVFAHLGGLAIQGFLACWAGVVARKKGYGFWWPFVQAFVAPIVLGVVAVLAVQLLGGHGCGAIVSLVAVVPVIVFYYLAGQKAARATWP